MAEEVAVAEKAAVVEVVAIAVGFRTEAHPPGKVRRPVVEEGSSSRGGNSAGGGHDTDGLSDGRGARGATAGVGQVAGVRIVIPITVEWDPTSACW